MDPFNLSRYANLTVQRVQPPEEKPKTVENEEEEEECSDEEDDLSGSEKEVNETLEIPQSEVISEGCDVPTLTNENVEVELEPNKIEDQQENESKNNEQTDEEIEANSKRKSGEDEDDQTPKKAKMNEDSKDILF